MSFFSKLFKPLCRYQRYPESTLKQLILDSLINKPEDWTIVQSKDEEPSHVFTTIGGKEVIIVAINPKTIEVFVDDDVRLIGLPIWIGLIWPAANAEERHRFFNLVRTLKTREWLYHQFSS